MMMIMMAMAEILLARQNNDKGILLPKLQKENI